MTTIIDGIKLAKKISDELKQEFSKIKYEIRLAIVLVGENEASRSFILQKKKFAEEINVKLKIYKISENISTRKLRKKIVEISKISKNKGIIVQLPLPENIDTQRILNAIPEDKDIDVLTERNLGKLMTNRLKILPPSVSVIKKIFEEYKVDLENKNVVVVGFGQLVGKPISVYLLNNGATVSVLNKNTKDISEFTKNADILISATGKPHLIKKEMIKEGTIVIDFGFSKINGKIVGDVDFENVIKKASLITPTPGGTGPILVAMIFQNLLNLVKSK